MEATAAATAVEEAAEVVAAVATEAVAHALLGAAVRRAVLEAQSMHPSDLVAYRLEAQPVAHELPLARR